MKILNKGAAGIEFRTRVTNPMFEPVCRSLARGRVGDCAVRGHHHISLSACARFALAASLLVFLALASVAFAQQPLAPESPFTQPPHQPPRVTQAEHFLRQRGWVPGRRLPARIAPSPTRPRPYSTAALAALSPDASSNSASTTAWQPLGPTAVQTPNFGLVTGRVAAIALDPSDSTGNRLYIGTTGGGVWFANNAASSTPASIVFSPLTDAVAALGSAAGASISVGALTVQPGGTGVILAGTGDPNDALDSYYGAGILRSTDSGNTWSLIQATTDYEDGLSGQDYTFIGEGFAGFAWSTANSQLVVAAVSQAFEGTLVDAATPGASYQGLYYSSDAGATWHLATITDGSGEEIQGPNNELASPDGNAVTAVVWNPVRQLFVAAVRYHGYYQSPDGITWTRMAAQPGSGLTTTMCPSNPTTIGSIACPIFRGALAVNPSSGDTFAWTVDLNSQDQGLWQDACAISGSACTNPTISFAKQWSTTPLETSTLQGPVTIADGVYNLALAAVPSQQDTLVLAGANDLWKCSLAMGCVWRNTTNSTSCMSAQVGEFQHALAWNAANPLEIFLGNDSGLWRSTDAISETGAACSASDSTHFQNLNGSLGSLAEPQSLSPVVTSPYSLFAGLGVNGFAGVKAASVTAIWPQILTGYGGPVAADPNSTANWYVNDQAGVAIYLCSQNAACTPSAFGVNPVVTDADVGGDGDAMPTPAPFLVDPVDSTQLLVGTCRVWRGPASGASWTAINAISPILDSGATNVPCNGDALIRSLAAMPIAPGTEIIYVGTYGSAYNGANLPGHVLSATFSDSSGTAPVWRDLTLNSVANDVNTLNDFGFDISSITIDPHDPTGNTVYVTVEGMETQKQDVQVVYRSTSAGATWTDVTANLPAAPASSLAVDPQNANVVYIATDRGVFFTTAVASCAQQLSNCWSVFSTGLPGAPAVALSATPTGVSPPVLVAATYGRGIWQTPLWSAGAALTTATVSPAGVAFTQTPAVGVASLPVAVQLQNTGSLPLTVSSIAITGADPADFSETDNCQGAADSVSAGASCTINVVFTPQAANLQRTAVLTIYANVYSGQLTVDLSGTGTLASGVITLSPNPVSFSPVEVGTTSAPLPVTIANSNAGAIPVSSISITGPFVIAGNACGATSIPGNTDCQVEVEFAPTQTGAAIGQLTFVDAAGTQSVGLTGTGEAPPTDGVNPTSLTFSGTPEGQLSNAQPVTITNNGDLPLTSISVTVSAQFQQTSSFVTQIAAHSTGTISVQFAPTQVGAVAGTLTITDALRTQTVALSGTGLAPPSITVAPASFTFTNQQPGVASTPQALTITNSGGSPMANVGFSITGAAASSYSVASTTCGATLAAAASCTAQIVFTPAATGSIAASLAVSSSTAGVAPVSVPLNGSGQLATALATNPSQITFPVVGAGQSSSAQSVVVTNSSSYAIAAVAIAAAGPFSITQNTCTGSLSAGANCGASVIFQPTAGGSSIGTLTVSSAAVATPATVALTGVGFDFSVAVSGSATQTVAQGQQANYTLVISPAGSAGTFAFSCGTLPANALCLFNPGSETLNAGVQGNVVVEISTAASSAQLHRPSPWRAAPLACAVFLLPLAFTRRRKFFLLVCLAVFLAAGVSSCTSSGGGTGGSSGSGGNGSGSATPTGTFTIPITVTSTGVSQSVDLTLTVD